MRRIFLSFVLATGLLSAAIAAASAPPCIGKNPRDLLPIMNSQVLQWRSSTPQQFQARAHIAGIVLRVLQDRTGHDHFLLQIGRDQRFVIEVIYNGDFGELPPVQQGMHVEACGDYITTKTSPAGAIIHWVHVNPGDRDGGRHMDGYVGVEQVFYGNTYKGRRLNWRGAPPQRR